MVSSFFSQLDGFMAGIPSPARLVLWALLAAAVSMGLYRLTSPQAALRDIRFRRAAVQQRLADYDGPTAEALPLLGASLRLAFTQLFRVLWPTAVAALPVLALILWLDMVYGYRFPGPDAPVTIETSPPATAARLEHPGQGGTSPGRDQWVVTVDDGARPAQHVALPQPVPAIYKPQWWSVLIANPAGYLPAEFPVDSIEIPLPHQEHLPFGPDWLRAWYTVFFAALFAASLGIKIGFRII